MLAQCLQATGISLRGPPSHCNHLIGPDLSVVSSNKSPSVHGSNWDGLMIKAQWTSGEVGHSLVSNFGTKIFSPVFMCFALIIYRLKLWNVQHVASLRSSEGNSGHKIFTKSPNNYSNITTSGSSSSERQGAYCKDCCRVRCYGTMKSRSVDRSASTKKKSVAGFSEKLRKVPHRVCVCVGWWVCLILIFCDTPWKINMEHNHGGLEDHFPF